MSMGTTAQKVISVLQNLFTVFGIPTLLVSDNGPPFGSQRLDEFFKSLGIKYMKSPPYHPPSNGVAEKYVSSVKNVFKKFVLGSERTMSIQDKINKFLLHQRTTPSTVTKRAPLDLIFKYKPKTMLDLVNNKKKFNFDLSKGSDLSENCCSKSIFNKVVNKQHKPKESIFKVGDKVLYKNHFKNVVR